MCVQRRRLLITRSLSTLYVHDAVFQFPDKGFPPLFVSDRTMSSSKIICVLMQGLRIYLAICFQKLVNSFIISFSPRQNLLRNKIKEKEHFSLVTHRFKLAQRLFVKYKSFVSSNYKKFISSDAYTSLWRTSTIL